MRNPQFAVAFGALGIVLALVGMSSSNALAQIPPDVLRSLPSDCPYISVIDVRKFMESALYAKSSKERQLMGEMGDDLVELIKITGIRPAIDISHLLVAGPRPELMIAIGQFDRKKISRYMLSNVSVSEMIYKNVILLPVARRIGNSTIITNIRVAFLTDRMIAFGPTNAIQGVIDTRAGMKSDLLSNPVMASLIAAVPSGTMFWFAGRTSLVIEKTPVPIPLGASAIFIQSVVGALEITDGVTGTISIATSSPNSAAAFENYHKKIAAAAQLLEEKDTGLGLLTEGLAIQQSGFQASLSLNFPSEKLISFWKWRNLPRNAAPNPGQTGESPAPPIMARGEDSPYPLIRPTPSYTEEARKRRIMGTVVIQCVIRKDGIPDTSKIVKGLGYGLDESAINTIARWRFIPAIVDGRPVDTWANIEVSFHLY
jgi:TonB family protein